MEATSLTYVLANPHVVGVIALRPLALLLVVAIPLFLLRRHAVARRARMLRIAAFLAVVGAVADLRLSTRLPTDRLTLVVAIDVSESIDVSGREWEQRYLGEIVRALAPGDELAVMTFATDVLVVRPPGPPAPVLGLVSPPSLTATDLSRAIASGMALFPAEGERRLLLLTDGNETRGNSRRQLERLRTAGIHVDVAIPPHRAETDIRVAKLLVAPLVDEDIAVPVRVVAYNTGTPRPAVLTLQLDGRIMDTVAVELQPGLNAFNLRSQMTGQGSHRLRAHLAVDDDATLGNNYLEAGVTVRGKRHCLLITPRGRSPLAIALEQKGFIIEMRPPTEFPSHMEELLSYHCMILEDVTADVISADALTNSERYVREFGGGFILVGGANTFGDARFSNTPLRHLLPVILEPRRPRQGTREPLALFLVIDRSNSMEYNSRIGTLRDGEKLRYAKQAALTVVAQLKDQDLVGVIAFDSQPREVSPLRPLRENRALLEDRIPRLVGNGGTDFYDALISARQQLAESRVNRRHVVLLTDGDTNRANLDEYRTLIRDIAADQISVTTIRIGDDTVNLQLLQHISRETGGAFHHVEDAKMLPNLMLRDTTQALSQLSPNGLHFYPELGSSNQLMQGIDARGIPPLADYAYAKAKDGADTLLHVARLERRDPLLAVWHYGLGRVAAFSASPSDDAEEWMDWPDFAKFWSQLTRWTGRQRTEDEYVVNAQRHDGLAEITVQTFGRETDDAVLVARLHVSAETVRDVSLAQREPRLFHASLDSIPGGRYPLTIIKRSRTGQLSQRTQLVSIPAADDEPQEEYQRSDPDIGLLTQLTEHTGGRLNPPAHSVVERPLGTRAAYYPLDHLLLPLAMLLLLGDVALRRLRPEPPTPTAPRYPARSESTLPTGTATRRGTKHRQTR